VFAQSRFQGEHMASMTILLGSIAFFAVVTLCVVVRRAASRAAEGAALRSMTVSRHWLIQHQSNDRA
jgi:hypothetical protein